MRACTIPAPATGVALLLCTLTRCVPLLTLDQIRELMGCSFRHARRQLAELVGQGMIGSSSVYMRELREVTGPVDTWSPGNGKPMRSAGSLSYFARERANAGELT